MQLGTIDDQLSETESKDDIEDEGEIVIFIVEDWEEHFTRKLNQFRSNNLK